MSIVCALADVGSNIVRTIAKSVLVCAFRRSSNCNIASRICSCSALSGTLRRYERRQMSSIAMPLKHRQNGTECQACRSRARAWRHSCVSLREAVRRSSDSLRIVLVPHCRPPESHLGRSDRASRVNGLPSREPEFKSNNLSLNVVWRSWGARARSNRAARLSMCIFLMRE